ncbi:1056_t:CDS:2 [Scutellospora calospora]|uniref:1056_t:CDS:1 n=1 Tax=Scutellospora calospora TaxID=85575 RepID=A0ACA9K328_9GLOM|nr:1056_t:CDS:2 [Scutellospora calospora]
MFQNENDGYVSVSISQLDHLYLNDTRVDTLITDKFLTRPNLSKRNEKQNKEKNNARKETYNMKEIWNVEI